MIIRLYSVGVWLFDLVVLLIKSYFTILTSIFTIFVPNRPKSIKKEIVLVVGAATGLGKEIAMQMGSLRATVLCMDSNYVESDRTVVEIRRDGGKAFNFNCNLTDEKAILKKIETIKTNIGRIDMLFLCLSKRSIAELELLQKETIVNLSPYVYLINQVLPLMKAKSKGHIVFLSSSVGRSKYSIDYRSQLPQNVCRLAIQEIHESLLKALRTLKFDQCIKTTLVQTYESSIVCDVGNPEIMTGKGWNFKIRVETAAANIIDAVRRNRTEIYVPKNCFYLSRFLKMLPPKITCFLSEFWGSELDFI